MLYSAYQREILMSGFELLFLGWLSDKKSDKVWGALMIEGTGEFYTFWGRRGKTLQFKKYDQKLHSTGWRGSPHQQTESQSRCELKDQAFRKRNKGYEDYTHNPEAIIEEFNTLVKKTFFNAKMMDKIR